MDIREDVLQCLETLKAEWRAAREDIPDFLEEISPDRKQLNEAFIRGVSEELRDQTRKRSRLPIGRSKWKKKTQALIFQFLYEENVIGIHQAMLPEEIIAFYKELTVFLKRVRQFAPKLPFDEIGQAIRNYIVYAMFKVIHLIPLGFNEAGFGYSMLYPITDNYIDGGRTPAEKQEYNQLIRYKLMGKEVHPRFEHHRKTCALLQAIASQYPREKDNRIYTLLLMMLEAQEESLRQQNPNTKLSEEERLHISIFKGGISVLVDRFLINKEMTPSDLHFYLGFGFFLQLADDLQDIREDSMKGSQTLFTINPSTECEERLVNKLLHFLNGIMNAYPAENDTFKKFVLSCSNQLVYTSLCGSKEFFSENYLSRMEGYLPISMDYLQGIKASSLEHQTNRVQKDYIRIMDQLIQ